MPTGSGKTVAFVTLAARLKKPTLVLVHRRELAAQAAQECRARWPKASVGLLPGDGWESARVVVATVQGLARKLPRFDPRRFGLVIVDEAHHAVSPSWQRALGHFTPEFVLGCTATPERLDGKDVEGLFGGVNYEYPLTEAMNEGVVVPVRQHGVFTNVSLADVTVGSRDFTRKRLAPVVRSPERTRQVVEAYLRHRDRPALFFAVDLAHVEQLRDELRRQGVRAGAVTGKTKDDERARVLRDFSEGRLDALVSCEVLTEGCDERRVSCVVMARPTASKALYQQCVGRGMRRDEAAGKEDCLVLDVIDRGAKAYPVVASDLFGARVPDCQGEDIRVAAEREKRRWRLHPVCPSASLQADWDLGHEARWGELPDLRGYAATGLWHSQPASQKQLRLLTRFYRLAIRRGSTRGGEPSDRPLQGTGGRVPDPRHGGAGIRPPRPRGMDPRHDQA
jgi:superfamily II DNA or RNA helicase